MITLGNGYSIKTDSTGVTLHFEEMRKKDNKEKTEKVDYLFTDDFYLLNVKQALNYYLQLQLKDCESIEELMIRMGEVEVVIKNLKM